MAFIWFGFYLETIGSSLDHDVMASIREKAISILARNLNSGRSYLITAVPLYDYKSRFKATRDQTDIFYNLLPFRSPTKLLQN